MPLGLTGASCALVIGCAVSGVTSPSLGRRCARPELRRWRGRSYEGVAFADHRWLSGGQLASWHRMRLWAAPTLLAALPVIAWSLPSLDARDGGHIHGMDAIAGDDAMGVSGECLLIAPWTRPCQTVSSSMQWDVSASLRKRKGSGIVASVACRQKDSRCESGWSHEWGATVPYRTRASAGCLYRRRYLQVRLGWYGQLCCQS